MNQLIECAISHHHKGRSVIAVNSEKRPYHEGWNKYFVHRQTEKEMEQEFVNSADGIALVLYPSCSFVVLDFDGIHADQAWIESGIELPDTARVKTRSGGKHLYFLMPPNPPAFKRKVRLVKSSCDCKKSCGVDLLIHGYVLVPPSPGYEYTNQGVIAAFLPQAILDKALSQDIPARKTGEGQQNKVTHGERNNVLVSLAGTMRKRGMSIDAIRAALLADNEARFDPPVSQRELESVLKSAERWEEPAKTVLLQQELWPDSLTVKEFLEQTPDNPDRWIWEDCMPLGSSSLLVAKPKVGKSTVSVALAMAISRGYAFLGRGVQKSKVLYVYLDGPKAEIKDIFVKFDMKESDTIRIFARSGAPGGGSTAVQWAISQIQKFDIKFVVIDPIQAFFQFKELKYEEIYPKMQPMQEAAEQYKCHILYCHHAGKGERDDLDSFIGSQAFRAIAYTMLHMKRLAPDSRQRILKSDQRSGRNFDEVAISDGSDGEIEKIGSIEEAWIENKKPLIKEFLSASPGVTEKEIMLAIDGRRMVVSKALRALLKVGEVERTGIAHSRKDPLRYFMAGDLVAKTDAELKPQIADLFRIK